ncbi:MAG: tetratricopeptide repeat protein [Pyrinomonadaceae bacterium]
MSIKNLLSIACGLLAGFVLGFILANAMSRQASEQSRTGEMAAAANTNTEQSVNGGGAQSTSGNTQPVLSDEEIRGAIARADAKPDDLKLQHDFGIALYRYQDTRFYPDVARFLKRALDADPGDRELTVLLGNVLFDIGQSSDPERFADARVYYQKALEMKADDENVRTDLGLTYFLGRPSDPQRAIAEYRKSLALNPRHENTLQALASALIATGRRDEAQKRIEELQKINPQHPALSNLRAQLAQSRNETQE